MQLVLYMQHPSLGETIDIYIKVGKGCQNRLIITSTQVHNMRRV